MANLDYEEQTSEEVRSYLGNVLPQSDVRRLADGEERQLLLLTMPQLVAGFGFTSRDLSGGYSRSYGAFKREYAAHRNEWDDLDLAFVLCVPAGIAGLQAFGSRVETDVFFCRKYVVPMNGHVGRSLARLPFLPLFTERGVAVRPPSAQTFLQESGVPAQLARYLVKKGERSARSVFDECVDGIFGKLPTPERSSRRGGRFTSAEETAAIEVKSISIEGFRAYRQKTELSFGEDLTVLFGPNGFGKTSVFDAIDFAFTGEIGRLQTRSEERFRRVASHLDSENGGSGVALTVGIDGETRRLVRRVTERKRAELDGISMDRKAALETLTGWRGPSADRIENMVSLFRATHLFGQEDQELAREFHSNCRLSSDVVARLLAYEDYHATRAKVSDVCDIATKEIRAVDAEVDEIAHLAESESEELESLGRALQRESPSEDLSSLVDAIAKRITAAGIELTSGEPTVETLRSWRVALETRSSSLRRRSEGLRGCLGLLEELPRRRQELVRAEKRLEDVNSRVALARKSTSEAGGQCREKTTRVDRIQARLRYLAERLDTLAWVEANRAAHAALDREVVTTTAGLNEKAGDLDRLGDTEKSLSTRLGDREARKASLTRARAETQSKLERGRAILEGMGGWEAKKKRLRANGEEEERLRKAVMDGWRSMERLGAALQAEEEEAHRLTAEIETTEAKHGELNELIEALEDHIEGGVCPTCGEDHGSRRELLERISTQLGRYVATDERVSRDVARKRIEEIRSTIEEAEKRAEGATSELSALGEERDTLAGEIEAFQVQMVEFGVLVGNDADLARKDVAAQCVELDRQCGEWTGELALASEEFENARTQWETTTRSIRMTQDEIAELNEKVEVASRRLARLVDDRRNQGDVGLASSTATVQEQRNSTETEVASTQKLLEEERESLRIDEESLSVSEAELAASETELDVLVGEIAKLNDRCREIESLLSDAGVEPGEDQDVVFDRARAQAEEASVVNLLIEDVADVELVIDAATTRAAYRRLQSRLAGRRSAKLELKSRRDAYAWWLDYFREVLALVAYEQDKAISTFTKEYGPRTSVIQRRLRSVYGFDDVEIRGEGSNILVRVLRDGKLLRPTDYFSQSQQQTLLLGLFLTACVSQTWSGLAPIFLDDPIAHFDDLNIFAFLDLMDGLLNDYGAGKRQLVVSTCDQKFVELAREKFAYRGERVKYYFFEGIGEDGPIVRTS